MSEKSFWRYYSGGKGYIQGQAGKPWKHEAGDIIEYKADGTQYAVSSVDNGLKVWDLDPQVYIIYAKFSGVQNDVSFSDSQSQHLVGSLPEYTLTGYYKVIDKASQQCGVWQADSSFGYTKVPGYEIQGGYPKYTSQLSIPNLMYMYVRSGQADQTKRGFTLSKTTHPSTQAQHYLVYYKCVQNATSSTNYTLNYKLKDAQWKPLTSRPLLKRHVLVYNNKGFRLYQTSNKIFASSIQDSVIYRHNISSGSTTPVDVDYCCSDDWLMQLIANGQSDSTHQLSIITTQSLKNKFIQLQNGSSYYIYTFVQSEQDVQSLTTPTIYNRYCYCYYIEPRAVKSYLKYKLHFISMNSEAVTQSLQHRNTVYQFKSQDYNTQSITLCTQGPTPTVTSGYLLPNTSQYIAISAATDGIEDDTHPAYSNYPGWWINPSNETGWIVNKIQQGSNPCLTPDTPFIGYIADSKYKYPSNITAFTVAIQEQVVKFTKGKFKSPSTTCPGTFPGWKWKTAYGKYNNQYQRLLYYIQKYGLAIDTKMGLNGSVAYKDDGKYGCDYYAISDKSYSQQTFDNWYDECTCTTSKCFSTGQAKWAHKFGYSKSSTGKPLPTVDSVTVQKVLQITCYAHFRAGQYSDFTKCGQYTYYQNNIKTEESGTQKQYYQYKCYRQAELPRQPAYINPSSNQLDNSCALQKLSKDTYLYTNLKRRTQIASNDPMPQNAMDQSSSISFSQCKIGGLYYRQYTVSAGTANYDFNVYSQKLLYSPQGFKKGAHTVDTGVGGRIISLQNLWWIQPLFVIGYGRLKSLGVNKIFDRFGGSNPSSCATFFEEYSHPIINSSLLYRDTRTPSSICKSVAELDGPISSTLYVLGSNYSVGGLNHPIDSYLVIFTATITMQWGKVNTRIEDSKVVFNRSGSAEFEYQLLAYNPQLITKQKEVSGFCDGNIMPESLYTHIKESALQKSDGSYYIVCYPYWRSAGQEVGYFTQSNDRFIFILTALSGSQRTTVYQDEGQKTTTRLVDVDNSNLRNLDNGYGIAVNAKIQSDRDITTAQKDYDKTQTLWGESVHTWKKGGFSQFTGKFTYKYLKSVMQAYAQSVQVKLPPDRPSAQYNGAYWNLFIGRWQNADGTAFTPAASAPSRLAVPYSHLTSKLELD